MGANSQEQASQNVNSWKTTNIQEYQLPGGSVVKSLPANAGDAGLVPGSGTSPGKGNGNPLQCSCLENPRDREAWRATVHEAAKESDTT